MNGLVFYHIAVASLNIEKKRHNYKFLGYTKEKTPFIDEIQGVKGQFIIAEGQPRIELLENLEGSHTLDIWLKNNTKMYHLAYYVKDLDKSIESFTNNRAKIIMHATKSVYFKNRICFYVAQYVRD